MDHQSHYPDYDREECVEHKCAEARAHRGEPNGAW